MAEYVEHYHCERNHQGLANELIQGPAAADTVGRIRRRPRLGGSSTTTVAQRDDRDGRFDGSAQQRDTTRPRLGDSCRKTGNHIMIFRNPNVLTATASKSFKKPTEGRRYTHCYSVNAEAGNDLTSQWESRAVELPLDSIPEAVGFSSGQQRDTCAVRPDTRGSANCEREGLPRLHVLGTCRHTR